MPTQLHLREAVEGDPRPYTRRFANYLDYPPRWLTVLRDRKYNAPHYRYRHGRACGCVRRIGYDLVLAIVVNREPLSIACFRLGVTSHLALRILESELRVIDAQVYEWTQKIPPPKGHQSSGEGSARRGATPATSA